MKDRDLEKFEMRPIGFVSRTSASENDRDRSLVAKVVLDEDLAPALDGIEEWSHIYMKLFKIFDHLYNAVLVDERYIILHGGIPSKASTMDDLAYAHKKHPQESHLEEILWSDPTENMSGIHYSPRGAGRLFGEDVTDKFLTMFNVKALIRGHEPSRDGFKINHNGKILTLFSRRGPPYHNRHGAYLLLNLSEKIKSVKQLEQCIYKF